MIQSGPDRSQPDGSRIEFKLLWCLQAVNLISPPTPMASIALQATLRSKPLEWMKQVLSTLGSSDSGKSQSRKHL